MNTAWERNHMGIDDGERLMKNAGGKVEIAHSPEEELELIRKGFGYWPPLSKADRHGSTNP